MSVDSDTQQDMIDSINYRLDKLQNNLTGAADIHQVQHYPFCALDMTSRIQNQISIFESKHANVKDLNSKLDELRPYLTSEEYLHDAEGISEVILSRADDIMKQASELERLEQLKQYDGTLSTDVSSLQHRVKPLIEVTLHQTHDTEKMTSQVQEVVARYNNVISAISNQFLVWDELLTKLETK
ncbi:Dynactin subunit 3-like isoform X2 [Oopsacas minuta]|uniref:Dynactin subunit 3-like isoform X2 n=1 Tax=Oopsacas minuta TaxID=111878 RepID=A0AAV7JD75_9METZ|nr:Dynactin subunit 3-like isoform X2 [Oopsacas minuta]